MTLFAHTAQPTPVHHHRVFSNPKVRDAAEFVLIWAGIVLLAIAVEVAGLYFVQLFE